MTISPTQAAEFLSAHDRYLILTHVRPDGDTVGCAAALCRALRTLGKTAHVLPNPEITPLFSPYLEGLLAPEDLLPDTVGVGRGIPVYEAAAVGGYGHIQGQGDVSGDRAQLPQDVVHQLAAGGPTGVQTGLPGEKLLGRVVVDGQIHPGEVG